MPGPAAAPHPAAGTGLKTQGGEEKRPEIPANGAGAGVVVHHGAKIYLHFLKNLSMKKA
jgi:hypothetical protein